MASTASSSYALSGATSSTSLPAAGAAASTATSVVAPVPGDIPPGDGVAIEAIGTVVEDGRGLVLCPFEQTVACPGLPLGGEVALGAGDQVRVGGRYDGVSLTVAWTEPWTPPTFQALLNPCTGEANLIQPPPEILGGVDPLLADMEDRMAGSWVSDGQIVVALTGDEDDAVEQLRGVEGLCVVTGFDYSANELVDIARDEVSPAVAAAGAPLLSVQVDSIPVPKITVEGDATDTGIIEVIGDRFGDLVEFETFMTVLDAPLADLPDQAPAVPGDVVLPTSGVRGDAAMAALVQGVSLVYDPDMNCLYVEGFAERTTVVWPYGYTAVAGDPTVVYDASGRPFAETGTPISLGGGELSADGVDPTQRCGAEHAWYMSGQTAYEILNR